MTMSDGNRESPETKESLLDTYRAREKKRQEWEDETIEWERERRKFVVAMEKERHSLYQTDIESSIVHREAHMRQLADVWAAAAEQAKALNRIADALEKIGGVR